MTEVDVLFNELALYSTTVITAVPPVEGWAILTVLLDPAMVTVGKNVVPFPDELENLTTETVTLTEPVVTETVPVPLFNNIDNKDETTFDVLPCCNNNLAC